MTPREPIEARPYVPEGARLRELSPQAVMLGVVLSAVLAGANAYLGLFAGMTVSASIPAAVLSMALLRVTGGTILENNAVQTAASAGESVAAGVIFTLPALILLGAWTEFDYLQTALLSGFGGLLGVLFTVPLRRALVTEGPLRFPEGVATAEVLKVGVGKPREEGDERAEAGRSGGGTGVIFVLVGAIAGALFKIGESGLRLWQGVIEGARPMFGTVLYAGANLSPALLGVGYIVGLNVALVVFAGGALNWFVAVPLLGAWQGVDTSDGAVGAAWRIWSEQTRYLGVGAMVVGGLWTLAALRSTLLEGMRTGLHAYRALTGGLAVPRTERDAPMPWVFGALLASLVPLGWVFFHVTGVVWVSALLAVVMLVSGFLFCAVAAYMAGLVGSSHNPVSGVTIATILMTSLLLLGVLGPEAAVGPAAAILVGSVVCCAAAIGGDNMQDLKAGHLLGATPYKQQLMQVLGVVAAALVLAPVLDLLLEAYGIGIATEERPRPLKAPQATLMAAVARGVFAGDLPWPIIAVGATLAAVVIVVDRALELRGSPVRIPVLAVAVGVYLPLELSVPILVGGVVSELARGGWRRAVTRAPSAAVADAERGRDLALRHGLLLCAGLITGEALAGIGLAIPIVVSGRADVLSPWGTFDVAWPGTLLVALVALLLARVSGAPRPARSG